MLTVCEHKNLWELKKLNLCEKQNKIYSDLDNNSLHFVLVFWVLYQGLKLKTFLKKMEFFWLSKNVTIGVVMEFPYGALLS